MTPTSLTLPVLTSRTRRVADVGSLLDHLGPGGFAWLAGGVGFVTSGSAARLPVGTGPDRFEHAAAAVTDLLSPASPDDAPGPSGRGPIAVGALPFDDANPGELIVPARVVGVGSDGTGWITETVPDGAPWPRPGPAPVPEAPGRYTVQARSSRHEWVSAVRAALAAIHAGRAAKVVLARDVVVEADRVLDARPILTRLAASHPSCFTFAAGRLVGSTPELLLRRLGDRVVSRPVAGTAPPGDQERLTRSPKERDEHRMVVDAVVAALRPVCGEIAVDAAPAVEQLVTVSHLVSAVEGRLVAPAPSALALIGLLHPTPAVAGVPRDEALRMISTLERLDRGCYAGPVGWVDGRGDGEWAVALRCAEVAGQSARLFAGAGIVAGSDPDAEWEETRAKLEPVLHALVRP